MRGLALLLLSLTACGPRVLVDGELVDVSTDQQWLVWRAGGHTRVGQIGSPEATAVDLGDVGSVQFAVLGDVIVYDTVDGTMLWRAGLTAPVRLETVPQAAVAPLSASWVVLNSPADRRLKIVVAASCTESGCPETVVCEAGGCSQVVAGANGSHAAFVQADGTAAVLDVDSGVVTPLGVPANEVAVSPHGSRVAVLAPVGAAGPGLSVLDSDSGAPVFTSPVNGRNLEFIDEDTVFLVNFSVTLEYLVQSRCNASGCVDVNSYGVRCALVRNLSGDGILFDCPRGGIPTPLYDDTVDHELVASASGGTMELRALSSNADAPLAQLPGPGFYRFIRGGHSVLGGEQSSRLRVAAPSGDTRVVADNAMSWLGRASPNRAYFTATTNEALQIFVADIP